MVLREQTPTFRYLKLARGRNLGPQPELAVSVAQAILLELKWHTLITSIDAVNATVIQYIIYY